MQWFLGMRYWYIQKCWRIWRKSRETLYPWAPSQSCIFFIYVRGDVMQWALIFLEARCSIIGHDRSNFILGMICYRGCYQISLSLQMYIQKVQNAQLLYLFWRVDTYTWRSLAILTLISMSCTPSSSSIEHFEDQIDWVGMFIYQCEFNWAPKSSSFSLSSHFIWRTVFINFLVLGCIYVVLQNWQFLFLQ